MIVPAIALLQKHFPLPLQDLFTVSSLLPDGEANNVVCGNLEISDIFFDSFVYKSVAHLALLWRSPQLTTSRRSSFKLVPRCSSTWDTCYRAHTLQTALAIEPEIASPSPRAIRETNDHPSLLSSPLSPLTPLSSLRSPSLPLMLRGSVSWISVGLSSADMGAERLIRLARRHKAY